VKLRPLTKMKSPGGLKCLGFLARLAVALTLCCGAWESARPQDALTSQKGRGKQIYVHGTSPSGNEIRAYFGESSLEVQGSAMACANCHGLDGLGKVEDGVNPPNITWMALTKPYGLNHADGRQHPPYSERTLELAVTRGKDPAGNTLLSVMPRYRMSRKDLADLVVYLKHLELDRDPGITANKIIIGTAVPSKGTLADMGQAIKAVTGAFFEQLNSAGGIYGRRVELKFVEIADKPSATRANVERFLKDGQIFAMTAAFISGSEQEIIPLMAQQEVPLIGPATLYAQVGFPLNRQVFYLLSGIDGQARALIDFVAKQPQFKNPGIVVVYPQSEINAGVVEAIKDQSTTEGLSAPRAYSYEAGHFEAAEASERLRQAGFDAVFFLGNSEEVLSFMREADKLGWFPSVFLPDASAGTGMFIAPIGFNGKIFLSFPTSPTDQTASGLREFRALAEKYDLPTNHVMAQILAYSAAKILVEGLTIAGKDLSREKLIGALEGMYDYHTGLTPTITFGPNRRIGAMGAYVVKIDLMEKQLLPASGWINLN
jgi:ABC-type branched-subunit amino acid transport system substrate-binding protein